MDIERDSFWLLLLMAEGLKQPKCPSVGLVTSMTVKLLVEHRTAVAQSPSVPMWKELPDALRSKMARITWSWVATAVKEIHAHVHTYPTRSDGTHKRTGHSQYPQETGLRDRETWKADFNFPFIFCHLLWNFGYIVVTMVIITLKVTAMHTALTMF